MSHINMGCLAEGRVEASTWWPRQSNSSGYNAYDRATAVVTMATKKQQQWLQRSRQSSSSGYNGHCTAAAVVTMATTEKQQWLQWPLHSSSSSGYNMATTDAWGA